MRMNFDHNPSGFGGGGSTGLIGLNKLVFVLL
jgi:hypothetical protein